MKLADQHFLTWHFLGISSDCAKAKDQHGMSSLSPLNEEPSFARTLLKARRTCAMAEVRNATYCCLEKNIEKGGK